MENASPESVPTVTVYACSGASNLGQLANQIALRLDRLGLAELACATEVGAEDQDEQSATNPVLAISGCASGCCAAMLARNGIEGSRAGLLPQRGVAQG